VLDDRPDGLDQILGIGGRDARHLEDVAAEHQPPDVRADQRRPQLTAVTGQEIAECREDERAEDVPQQPAGPVVGQARPEDGRHLLADLGTLLPQPDEPPDELFSGPAGRGGGQAGEHGGGVLRRLERGEQKPVLVAEVVVDERRVDPGPGGHGAHGGALEPAFREQFPGRVQDGPARVRAAQRAPAPHRH
jgi:hypothetical protein